MDSTVSKLFVVLAATGGLFLPGSALGQGTNLASPVRNDVNAEWVESSSPTPGGGRVTTTKFPDSERLLTKVVEPAVAPLPAASQRPQLATQGALPGGVVPAVGYGGYTPIPAGNGSYLVPTISYVPMSSNTMASYQAAYLPVNQANLNCPNCQVPAVPAYQPTAATQTPVLPGPVASGNLQVPMANANPGFYNQVPTAPAVAPSGYKALIPRSLPAGTYIGQGWAGQPKAYVNSQPVRNFLRYLIVP